MKNKKNTINLDHSRIKNRSKDVQEYRDNLAKSLKGLRALRPLGKKIAEKIFFEASNLNYIIDRYGHTRLGTEN